MNHHCATCARPLPDVAPEHIGPVAFCSPSCVTAWFCDGRHNRRHATAPIVVERRAS